MDQDLLNPGPPAEPVAPPSPTSPVRAKVVPAGKEIPTYNMEKEVEISLEEFQKKKRHLIVMTEVGKPVYTRWGEESEISPIVATFNVIINKLRSIRGDGSTLELKRMETNKTKTLIFLRNHLFFVYITQEKTDHPYMIERLVETVSHQVTTNTNSDRLLYFRLIYPTSRNYPKQQPRSKS